MQRGRPKYRPYLLQMSTRFPLTPIDVGTSASKRSTTRSMSICCTLSRSTLQTTNLRAFANSRGGTCPSAPCLATPLVGAYSRPDVCTQSVKIAPDLNFPKLRSQAYPHPVRNHNLHQNHLPIPLSRRLQL